MIVMLLACSIYDATSVPSQLNLHNTQNRLCLELQTSVALRSVPSTSMTLEIWLPCTKRRRKSFNSTSTIRPGVRFLGRDGQRTGLHFGVKHLSASSCTCCNECASLLSSPGGYLQQVRGSARNLLTRCFPADAGSVVGFLEAAFFCTTAVRTT